MLLLWYWRDDSDDCNYIILQSECDGKFTLEWTLILAICLICYSHHSSRWHLELLVFQYRLAFYYQGWWTLCWSYIKLPLQSLFYYIGIWIPTNTKESQSFRLFKFSSNNGDGLSVMIINERTVKITQSLIEESLALWMGCIVLSKENEDYRVFNWLQMLKRLISESLGEITMTLIVELMTFNDPFMMIDSDMNSSESQKQHFQLLSLYHTARTFIIKESKLRNGKLYDTNRCFAATMVKDIYIWSWEMQRVMDYRVWNNKQSSLVKETYSYRLNAPKTMESYLSLSKPQLVHHIWIDDVQH